MKRRVVFSCVLGCLLVVGVMFVTDGVPAVAKNGPGVVADAAKPAVEDKVVEHAIARTELPAVEVSVQAARKKRAKKKGGNGIGPCVSRCEEERQILFQSCLDAGGAADNCAAEANIIAQSCKADCRARNGTP